MASPLEAAGELIASFAVLFTRFRASMLVRRGFAREMRTDDVMFRGSP